MKKLCIYHGNCADGFGAAWVVRKRFGEDDVEFFPGVYQQDPPDVAGRDVIMVDFSYKRPVLEKMAESAKSILVIDHHKTAAEDLSGFPSPIGYPMFFHGAGIRTHFDMNHSGAMLTWMYFFPNEKPPRLIRHIEDRDLWMFKLPHTREIQAAVFSYEYDFEQWDILMDGDPMSGLANEGEAIERKHFKDIREFIKVAARRMFIGGHDVPVLNCAYFWSSDAGHIMAERNLFAACYWDQPDGRVFSLRSQEGGLDVSVVAKQYGGGGHAHAAGFKIPFSRAGHDRILDEPI